MNPAWRYRCAIALAFGTLSSACSSSDQADNGPVAPALNAALVKAASPQAEHVKPTPSLVKDHFVKPALRCSECHSGAYQGWKDSAHAQASTSAPYKAMRKQAPPVEAATCDRCHSPFAGRIPARHLALREGVNCDGCHMVSEAKLEQEGHATLTYKIADNVKYSTLDDAKDHYFHRVRYSEAHGEAELCAGCHQYSRTLSDGTKLPVYTEYQEWSEGPWGDIGLPCQTCHMREYTGEAAVGEGERSGLKDHAFIESGGDLRTGVIEAALKASRQGDSIRLHGTVTNKRAAHFIPTGLPARRIELSAYAVDKDGHRGPDHTLSFGRVLVDQQGSEVPFYRAVRVASDTRIGPKEEREIDLRIVAPPGAGTLHVDLQWVAFSRPIAKAMALEDIKTEQLHSLELRFAKAKRKTE